MRKLIVLCKLSGMVYVIDYDMNVHEDAFACIKAANDFYGTAINTKHVDFMDVEKGQITIL